MKLCIALCVSLYLVHCAHSEFSGQQAAHQRDILKSGENQPVSDGDDIKNIYEEIKLIKARKLRHREDLELRETVYAKAMGELTEKIAKLSRSSREYDLSSLPMGTIMPYLPTPGAPGEPDPRGIPAGWVPCDGQYIEEGPWLNIQLPNLNDEENGHGLFLRGGSEKLAGTIEQDAIQYHEHEDPGHTHIDTGHTHEDTGHTHEDWGHTHDGVYSYQDNDHGYIYAAGVDLQPVTSTFKQPLPSSQADIQNSTANINEDFVNIIVAKSNITGPSGDDVRIAGETRPANMRMIWIIKVQPAGWTPEE